MVDALSHKSFLCAISMPNNPILAKVKDLGSFDEEYLKLCKLVQTGDVRTLDQGYLVSGDCLYFKDRLCIPKNQDLKKVIFYEAHDSQPQVTQDTPKHLMLCDEATIGRD